MMLLGGQTSDDALLGERGLNDGVGVFKTIALRDDCLLSWGPQLGRLRRSRDVLGLKLPTVNLLFDEAPAEADGQSRGIVKIVLTRGGGRRCYQPPSPVRTRRIVVWRDRPTGLAQCKTSTVC